MKRIDASRRLFLRQAAAVSGLGAVGAPLALNLAAMGSVAAATAGDYRALVCIFLFGGSDNANLVLPTDAASWTNYTNVRNQAPDPIALLAPGVAPNPNAVAASPARLGGVLPITPLRNQGRTFALHPMMATMQTMFNTDKRLAVLANVGTLIQPTTKVQYGQANYPKPVNLFSHNDQQNTWQALAPEGASRGWGGRIADMVASQNTNATFTAVSATGNSVWLAGQTVQQYQVSTSGAIRLGADASGNVYGSPDLTASLQRVVSGVRGTHVMEADLANVAARSISAEALLRGALKPASDPLFGTPPATGPYVADNDPKLRYDNPLTGGKSPNSLAQQLQVVARMIDAGRSSALVGAKRQVFFVSLGGFDTHDGQNRTQADLFARVAQAMRYFDTTLAGLGASGQVTTFTASDFGRSFTSNGDGTDHGWGSHHFVMGGAVKGGDIYGTFPIIGAKNANDNNFDSSPDQLGNGTFLPTTSVDQLGATLGRWFGLTESQVMDVFPRLANWDPSKRDLGFLV